MERTQQQQKQQEPAQVSITRSYPVAPEKVWRAWTDPQALIQWFGPSRSGPVSLAEIDLCVGGRYRIAFDSSDGKPHEVSGVYQEVVPHRRLVFTWAWKRTPEQVSRVSIDLVPMKHGGGKGTELRFVHDRFFDVEARDNHELGWMPSFAKLGDFLNLDSQKV